MTYNPDNEFDMTAQVGDGLLLASLSKKMNNGIFKLDLANVKSALVYGVMWGLLAMGVYAMKIGDVFALNLHDLINAGTFGFLAVAISLLKNLLTTNEGKFLGSVKVISPTK